MKTAIAKIVTAAAAAVVLAAASVLREPVGV